MCWRSGQRRRRLRQVDSVLSPAWVVRKKPLKNRPFRSRKTPLTRNVSFARLLMAPVGRSCVSTRIAAFLAPRAKTSGRSLMLFTRQRPVASSTWSWPGRSIASAAAFKIWWASSRKSMPLALTYSCISRASTPHRRAARPCFRCLVSSPSSSARSFKNGSAPAFGALRQRQAARTAANRAVDIAEAEQMSAPTQTAQRVQAQNRRGVD
jgi:hypothetical protein